LECYIPEWNAKFQNGMLRIDTLNFFSLNKIKKIKYIKIPSKYNENE
jgi:hypothetical protein